MNVEPTFTSHLGRTVRLSLKKKKHAKDLPRCTKNEAFRYLIGMDPLGHVFTEEEAALYAPSDRKYTEGNSERAVRRALGLPYEAKDVPGGSSTVDIPERNTEIKDIVGFTKSGTVVFRGQAKFQGRVLDIWRKVFLDVGRMYGDDDLPEQVWTAFIRDEVSKSTHEGMPDAIKDLIARRMAPEVTMAEHSAIALSGPEGFLMVPREDYADAFEFTGITRGQARYDTRWEYIVNRIVRNLSERPAARTAGTTFPPSAQACSKSLPREVATVQADGQ